MELAAMQPASMEFASVEQLRRIDTPAARAQRLLPGRLRFATVLRALIEDGMIAPHDVARARDTARQSSGSGGDHGRGNPGQLAAAGVSIPG